MYPNELAHYGVKGMKWGVRRARKLQNKAGIARESAREWDEMAARARAKGRTAKADKYSANAKQDRADAGKYESKASRMAERRYKKAGKRAGMADYEREKGDRAYKSHDDNAKVMDKMAAKYEKSGNYIKAEAMRKSAAAVRARGENVRAGHYETANAYMKRSEHLNQKAESFASEAKVNVGKNKVNDIMKKARDEGYKNAKAWDDMEREDKIRDRFGDSGVDMYNKLHGKR